jgi:hypothetical protein
MGVYQMICEMQNPLENRSGIRITAVKCLRSAIKAIYYLLYVLPR